MPLPTPFLEYAWLNLLETSGSAVSQAGWQPHHLVVWRGGTLVAAAPLYLKSHSYGEFVFDQVWADLAQRLRLNYYPKLVGMSPFTPAVGYRFLIAPGEDERELTALMVQEIRRFCEQHHLGGCHFLFVDPQWRHQLIDQGFRAWQHHNYVWENRGYETFADYLGTFNSNQRRNIKRERQAIARQGLQLLCHQGEAIPAPLFPLMYKFYAETCDKFGWWGSKYLTRQFFAQLATQYQHRVIFFAAYAADRPLDPLGMSFCIRKGDQLYGRYWGAWTDIDCLHFEACYYRPIEWAISQGVQRFDPGAGGSHKQRRGFRAQANQSLHWLCHPQLRTIMDRHIDDINDQEQAHMEAINQELPLRQGDSSA